MWSMWTLLCYTAGSIKCKTGYSVPFNDDFLYNCESMYKDSCLLKIKLIINNQISLSTITVVKRKHFMFN